MKAATARRLFLSICLILALTTHGSAQLGGISLPVIVQISPAANITVIASVLGATIVDSIPDSSIYLLNVPVRGPAAVMTPINLLPGVLWQELNVSVSLPAFAQLGLVTIPGTAGSNWYKDQPSWQLIEAQNAQAYSTGAGVLVADINSQVDYSHPALIGHLTAGYDFVANRPDGYSVLNQSEAGYLDQWEAGYLDQSEAGYLDQFGAVLILTGTPVIPAIQSVNPAYSHGTLCAGIIAAIAPGSMIMPLRTFDNNGQSDLFSISKAIRYAVQHGAQVVNMSFGTLSSSRALQSSIQYAQQNNVLLTASAGNNNTSTPQYPAAYSGVMAAAATNLFDYKAHFSNYGSDIFADAPGVNIISTYPHGYYSIVSGTSFSAPTLAATAALVRSLTSTGVPNAIAAGAVNIDSQNPNYAGQLGYGRIDVLHAARGQ